MPLSEVARAIQELPLFTAVRESALVYPILLSTHLSGIALFGGAILMTNLRLLGVAMMGQAAGEVVRGLRWWKFTGLATMATTGILLAGAKAGMYYANPYFQTKIGLLVLVGLHAWIFRGRVDGRVARGAACLSLGLWLGIVTCGRMIAYWEGDSGAAQVHGGLGKRAASLPHSGLGVADRFHRVDGQPGSRGEGGHEQREQEHPERDGDQHRPFDGGDSVHLAAEDHGRGNTQ